MRRIHLPALSLLCACLACPAVAADVSVSAGRTTQSSNVFRLSTQIDFGERWLQSDTGHLGGYWDAAYSYWDGRKSSSSHSLSVSPVLAYEFSGSRLRPYLEGGIGAALFSSTRVEDKRLGSSFQFEDRLGAGVRFAGQEIGVSVWHYSNAGIKEPNDGINAYSLHYRVRF